MFSISCVPCCSEHDSAKEFLDIDANPITTEINRICGRSPEPPHAVQYDNVGEYFDHEMFTDEDEPKIHGFTVTVHKSGKGFGLDISWHDGITLLIGKVKDGPVADWNRREGRIPSDTVMRGDRIIEVNGVSGSSSELLTALRNSTEQTLRIKRLLEFMIVVASKEGETHGLDFDISPVGELLVKRVHRGLVAEANKIARSDNEIRPGDRIVAVNGARAPPRTLIAFLSEIGQRSNEDFELWLRRPRELAQTE
jgi:C-terminal processing protease CtpA/Prc